MATPRISPPDRTMRRYVRAYCALGEGYTPRRERTAADLLRGMAHWYDDSLDLAWGCDCDACSWWREQLTIHRRGRARN